MAVYGRVRKKDSKADDRTTHVRGVHAVLDDIIEETGQSSARQGRTFRGDNTLGILHI